MSADDEGRIGIRISASVTVLAALLLLYVLSYAPMMQITATHVAPGSYTSPHGHRITVGKLTIYPVRHWGYAPVRWLTASTPLREPLLMWADLWGMREILETQNP